MERSKKSEIPRAEAVTNIARYQYDMVEFVHDILRPKEIYPYQKDILNAIGVPNTTQRVAWHKAHGVGGTAVMAWAAIAFLFTRPQSRVVTTASVNRQVRDILWPEIHKWMRKANFIPLGWKWPYTLLDMKLEINQEWFAIGASSDIPENMEGFHAPYMLYIVDEAKTVSKGIFDAIEGALTGEKENKLLVVSTPPLGKEGHFYEICRGAYDGWKVFHTDAHDSPNVPKLWIEQKEKDWGIKSPEYVSKVLGLFPDSSEDTLIPLSWVEMAVERWESAKDQTHGGERVLGVDVARFGGDETVLALREGFFFPPFVHHIKEETMQTAGRVIVEVDRRKAEEVHVDVIGVGAGVFDRVNEIAHARSSDDNERSFSVKPVNVALKAPAMMYKGERIKFKRLRDRLYWNMRCHLDPDNEKPDELICLPNDDKLRKQLTSIRYKITSDGEIEVEGKDSLKSRGLDSPDRAEAVMIALADTYEGWTATLK